MVYYYKKKLPSIDDIVIGRVETINEYGIEISLIEYNNIKGYINCGDVSRKKKVNFNKLLTVGKDVILHVIQVDQISKNIDLSKRTVSDEDIKLFNQKHVQHIQLYNLFKHLYMKLFNINNLIHLDETKLYEFQSNTLFEIQTCFENENLFSQITNKETFNEIIDSIDFDSIGKSRQEFIKILEEYINDKINRIKPEITETIKLMTYSINGVKDIKNTLDYENFTEYSELQKDFVIKINYISGSTYLIIIEQKDFELVGNISIEDALSSIKKEIKKRALNFQIQNQIVL